MKKIGILTLPLNNNYGGTLQAFALYEHLKRQHYDVHLIQKEAYRPEWKKKLIRILEITPFQDFKKHRSTFIKNKYHQAFINKYIPQRTTKSSTTSELEKVAARYNFHAVIVGSDQVWRLDYIDDGYYSNFFLDFIKSPKTLKISYAASFGKDIWQDTAKVKEVEKLLKDFDFVSTRELTGVGVCVNHFNVDKCEHVLDPTLMVDSAIYDCFLSPHPNPQDKILLTYILDHNQNKNNILADVSNSLPELHQLTPIYDNDSHTPRYDVGQWVNLFSNADFVVTDSFHGMVFSIIFNKQFVVIGNKGRGLARFNSLLAMLGLESRLIVDGDNYSITNIMSTSIDYELVQTTISDLRLHSQNFLASSLLRSE